MPDTSELLHHVRDMAVPKDVAGQLFDLRLVREQPLSSRIAHTVRTARTAGLHEAAETMLLR